MAQELRNGRDNEKCRSHHQKMLKKYKTIENIIRALSGEKQECEEPVPIFRGLGAFKLYQGDSVDN